MRKRYVFDISAEKDGYVCGPYWLMIYGTGADTLDEIEKEARRFATWHTERVARFETGRFRVEVRKPCDVCKVTGIKPGCKRKACEECLGKGATNLTEYVFQVQGGAS